MGGKISFEPGFTCITGGIGQGKSTILLAIDFALTGKPLTGSYQYLLRESEVRGVVELEFEHGGRMFKVHRVLERVKSEIRQKSDECWLESSGRIIAKGKIEPVNAAIAAQTLVDPEVLREVAWIKQERLKLLLNLRREERQVLLDSLLGLEELRQIAENLGETERTLSDKILALEQSSGGLEDDKRELERKTNRHSSLKAEVKEVEESLVESRAKLDEIEQNLFAIKERSEEFESQKQDLSALQQKLTDLEQSMKKNQTALKRQNERKSDLEDKLKKEEKSFQALQESFRRFGFEDKLTRESLTAAVRLLREKKDFLREQLLNLQHSSEESSRAISLLQDKDKCPLCRQGMVPLYRSTIIQMFEADLLSKQNEATAVQTDQEKAEGDLAALEGLLDSLSLVSTEKYQPSLEETQRLSLELEREIQVQKREHAKTGALLEERKEALTRYAGIGDAVQKVEEERNQQTRRVSEFDERRKQLTRQNKEIEAEIVILEARIQQKQKAEQETKQRKAGLQLTSRLRDFIKEIRPRLRSDFLDDLQTEVQRVLDEARSTDESAYVELDEFYTPSLIMAGQKRLADQLSGGERTLLAFTLNVGLAQLVFELKSHQSLDLMLLDEPTESLGTEDASIQRLAETIRSMKSIPQIIAVTHSEDFGQYADHILVVTKQLNQSKVEPLA